MKWQTPVSFPDLNPKADLNSRIFSAGSCFSEELSTRLQAAEIPVLSNPFGTLFSPLAIAQMLERLSTRKMFEEKDLILYQDRFYSLEHSGRFSGKDPKKLLDELNAVTENATDFLNKTHTLCLTLGSAFYYVFLPLNKSVANCHKIPGKYFEKKRLTPEEVAEALSTALDRLFMHFPDISVQLTVSPVRHIREGMAENQLSKSILRVAAAMLEEKYEKVAYLPVYEVFMDELRDYRFYAEDMIHPSPAAVDYVVGKWIEACCTDSLAHFIKENLALRKGLTHRPVFPEAEAYKTHLKKLLEKIQLQQNKVHYPVFADAKEDIRKKIS